MTVVNLRNSREQTELASERANALAERLERGATALEAFASVLTPEEWATPVPHDGRTIGVVVHHVGNMYPLEIQVAQQIAAGTPITGVTSAGINQINAEHAAANAGVTKREALDFLRKNSAMAAAAIRAMSDEELDTAVPVSLYEDAPLTTQFFIEDHAMRHSYHHLMLIRRALKR